MQLIPIEHRQKIIATAEKALEASELLRSAIAIGEKGGILEAVDDALASIEIVRGTLRDARKAMIHE